jgi:hypothetical protein
MSQQRKSDGQHPNSYYREGEETEHAATNERDTSRHSQPFGTLPAKAIQVLADPGRDVIFWKRSISSWKSGICVIDLSLRSPAAILLHGRPDGFYPVRSRRATLKNVAAIRVTAPKTVKWIAES